MANMLTFLRIPLAIAMLFATPFSTAFWGLYLGCGFTDIADGLVARMLHQESCFGAKIDSIADFIFSVCVAIFLMPILYRLCGLTFTGIILCIVAFFSSLEKLVIMIKSKELKRDCKSIFIR